MGENCNICPMICMNCAYQSTKVLTRWTCKLCKVTEKMQDFDMDAQDIDTSVNSHNIQMVASVSFDRQKRQFKYDGNHEEVFGKDVAN